MCRCGRRRARWLGSAREDRRDATRRVHQHQELRDKFLRRDTRQGARNALAFMQDERRQRVGGLPCSVRNAEPAGTLTMRTCRQARVQSAASRRPCRIPVSERSGHDLNADATVAGWHSRTASVTRSSRIGATALSSKGSCGFERRDDRSRPRALAGGSRGAPSLSTREGSARCRRQRTRPAQPAHHGCSSSYSTRLSLTGVSGNRGEPEHIRPGCHSQRGRCPGSGEMRDATNPREQPGIRARAVREGALSWPLLVRERSR